MKKENKKYCSEKLQALTAQKDSALEFVKSKDSHIIPIYQKKALHSRYFPLKESEKYTSQSDSVVIAIGAGGCLDVFAGNVQRAPEFYCKHGIEWLYRLIKQPSRFVRMLALPKFGLKVLFKGKKYQKKEK